jgi:hypothetical protein
MTRCSTLLLITSAALLAGCGGKKDDEPAATGSANTPPAAEKEAASDLSQKPRKTVTSHAGAVEISIDLPEEASPPHLGTDSVSYDFKGTAMQLTITAHAVPIAAGELTAKRELSEEGRTQKTEELLRADETSGGYIVTKARKDKTWFSFEHCRSIPYGNVCCSGSLRAKEPIEGMRVVIDWLTDVCHHMTVNGEAHLPPATVDPRKTKG